ncbi:hypothetical protein BBJ28_00022364 [Nothophytophthora sp. Chile5]|nr:hypothetical protein BBJ28_00022364 [Nothophytophthora sp. Chile5]
MQADPLPPTPSMADVHAAWLAAGARADVAAMRDLRRQHPDWLDLRRVKVVSVGRKARPFLLEAGQSADTGDDSGMTPLMTAVTHFNLVTMRCVFRNNVAVRRNTVMDASVELLQRVITTAELLVRFGANVDARTQDGKTALHFTTNDDIYEVTKLLLNYGADIDAQDKNGKTALHYCVKEDSLLVTNLLVSRGAQIDLEDGSGITPLALVLLRRRLNVLQIVMNHHQMVATAFRHDFATAVLLQAVDYQADEVVRFIVENEYAVATVCNAVGETPMHRAIVRRNPRIMELLADLDPDTLLATTLAGASPAHYAARYGSQREVETLLHCFTRAFGEQVALGDAANPLNAADRRGLTSLYVAGTAQLSSGEETDLIHDQINAETGSLATRDAKVQLLLRFGARLFPPHFLAHQLAGAASTSSTALLPLKVRRCLALWLIEGPAQSHEVGLQGEAWVAIDTSLTALCMRWVASVVLSGPSANLVPILISAGYTHELIPLLLELPLHRSQIPTVLRQLELFARARPSRALVLQLHDELLEAWESLPVTLT